MDIFKFGQRILNRIDDAATGDKVIVRDVSQTEDNNGFYEMTLAQLAGFNGSTGIAGAGTALATPTRTVSAKLVHTGGTGLTATTDGTNLTDVVLGTVYLVEVFVPCNMTVTGVALYNGTAVAGNGKVMLYSWVSTTATRLATSASTAMSGTTAYQRIPFAAPISVIGPCSYLVGCTFDTTTHDLRCHALGNFVAESVAGGTYGTDSTFATLTVVGTAFNTSCGTIGGLY